MTQKTFLKLRRKPNSSANGSFSSKRRYAVARCLCAAVAFVVFGLLDRAAHAAEHVALLVSNDVGIAGDQPLRHTKTDVDRFGAVLRELGGFRGQDIRIVSEAQAPAVLDALERIVASGNAGRFVFYYSGHADAEALHMDGSMLPVALLLERIRKVSANVRLVVLDACHSGSATRVKGVRRGPSFDIRAEDQQAGQVVISSSAEDEQSFESESHGGALFTLHWTTGLRGAADRNGDGQVTLAEAYAYAYAQTLRATLLSPTGPQHPSFRFDLVGQRDPVLTSLSTGAALTVRPGSDGTYAIFDARERDVIAEMAASPSEERRISLAPGEYVVKKRSPSDLRTARIQIARGDDRVLFDHEMTVVPWARLSTKGSLGNAWLFGEVGQTNSPFTPGDILARFGIAAEGLRWTLGVDAALSTGTRNGALDTDTVTVGATGSALYTLRWRALTLAGGPTAGPLLIVQTPDTRGTQKSLGALLGARLRLNIGVAPHLELLAGLDGDGLVVRAEDDHAPSVPVAGGFRVFPWLSYGFGFRAGF